MRHAPARRTRALAPILGLALALVATTAVSATEFPAGREGYHSYTEVAADVAAVAAAHPDIVTRFSIGKSYQGRELWAAKISDNVAVDEAEPEVLFDGGTHADEHMGVEMALHILHWLVDGYGTDARITNIVNGHEVWIVFLVNPDGAEYDISGGKFHYWRKNRQPTPGSKSIGTDLNRNFGYKWGGGGRTSTQPRGHHLPWSVRLLVARGLARCATSWPVASSTAVSRSGPRSRSTSTAAWSCGRTATR